jgi:hypothetical protein
MAEHKTDREQWLAMIQHDTGRHFLDSGGAYGRHHERNAGLTLADVEWDFRLNVRAYGWDITRNVVDALCTFFTIDNDLTTALHTEAEAMPDASWREVIESFFKTQFGTENVGGYNTYNGESFLSQCVQYWNCTAETDWDETTYYAIQTHNGCDIRGGYSYPVIATLQDEDAWFDVSCCDLRCSGGHGFYTDDTWNWYGHNDEGNYKSDDFKIIKASTPWLQCPVPGCRCKVTL